jgi:hypothetical protein
MRRSVVLKAARWGLGERKEEEEAGRVTEVAGLRERRFWPRRAIRRPLINWPCIWSVPLFTFFFEKGRYTEESNNSDYLDIEQGVTESLAWGRRGSLVSITYNEAEFGGLCVTRVWGELDSSVSNLLLAD